MHTVCLNIKDSMNMNAFLITINFQVESMPLRLSKTGHFPKVVRESRKDIQFNTSINSCFQNWSRYTEKKHDKGRTIQMFRK